MIAKLVFLLCAITSIGCAVLLIRSYTQSRARLLFWSALCFFCLAISNIILFFDLVIIPNTDLSIYRSGMTLIGLLVLVYGLIWETS